MKQINNVLKTLLIIFSMLGISTNLLGATYYGQAYAWPNTSTDGSSNAGGVYVSYKGNKPSSDSDYKAYDNSSNSTSITTWLVSFRFQAKAKTGYSFAGWYNSSSYTSKVTDDNPYTGLNKDLTLYAKFTPNEYSVNFNANGGSVAPTSKKVTYDAPYGTLPAEPAVSRAGYTFAGWWTSATGGTEVTATTPVKITSEQTLYAHWTPNTYTVTLKPNGGTPNTDQTVIATYDAAMPTTLKAGGSISAPNKEGYTFSGYYDAKKDGVQYYKADLSSAKNWDKTGNTNLFAHWTANTYTIVYDANGGTGMTNSSSHTYDVAKTLTKNGYSKTGYSFVGWATSKALADAGTKAYDNEQSVINLSATQEATITLYAIWTVNNYKIYLNNQSATTPGTEIVEVTYDSNVNLTSGITPPTKTNCTFEGYYTDAGCIETKRIDKNGAWQEANGFIVDGKWNCAGDVTLYAYWKQNQTITWEWTPEAGVEYTTGTVFDATATSGLPVYYTSSDEEVAKIVDNNKLFVVTPNAEVTIIAHQDGNHDWNIAPTESKTFTTLGATPNDTSAVSAKDITYGKTLSESGLSGDVKFNGVTIPGTLTWLEPTTLPNAGANQPFAVRFTPDNLAAYSAIEFYVKVNVDKATPVFTWNISNILRENVRYSNFVTSTNKESAISSYASPSTYITASGVTLTTGEVDDVVNNIRIIVMQGTTDNYVAKNETFTVSIYPKSTVCLPFEPLNESQYNNAQVEQHDNVEWCNTNAVGNGMYAYIYPVSFTQHEGIAMGSWLGGLNYDDKFETLFFSGIPETISFTAYTQTVTTSKHVHWPATAGNIAVKESADGVNFTEVVSELSVSSSGTSFSHSLEENTRFVKLIYSGNFTCYFQNVTITQKKYLNTDKASLTFGTETHPLQEPQTIKVSYSSLGVCGGLNDAITITSSNPAFYVDETSITENVGRELKGEYTVRVRCNDVNQNGTITFSSNDGTSKTVIVRSTKPLISTTATKVFQTGTEHAPVTDTDYRALRTHDFSACFNGSPIFDTLYVYGVSESDSTARQWEYDAKKKYNVPAIDAAAGNVYTPCFVYKKDGAQYTYVRTFGAATETLSISADGKKLGFVGYKPASLATTIPAIQLNGGTTEVYLNNTEMQASGAVLVANDPCTLYACGSNIMASATNASVKLSGATTLSIEDSWKAGEASAILALRPATSYPSINLGSASGRVDVNGTQLELHNATNMAVAHMEGTTEKYDGEVHINDGTIGGEATLGMPKRTFIDGGTFNDGTVAAYTLKGIAKSPRNSRGDMVSRHTMSKDALASAYSWYGQAHLTPDGSSKVNPMLMDEEVWIFNGGDVAEEKEDYNNKANWNKDGVPGENDDVLINAPMVISGGEMKVHSITINWEDKGKGIPAITINPNGGLTVGDGGVDALKVVNKIENLVLKAGQADELKGQTGFLRVHPKSAEPMPEATVELYSTTWYNSNNEAGNTTRFQCIGTPIEDDGIVASSVFPAGTMLYAWKEDTEKWTSSRTKKLEPFKGYDLSQRLNEEGLLITYSGLLSAKDTSIDLSHTSSEKGFNLLANSYTAPISIENFSDDDFVNVNKTIYILNAGTKLESDKQEGGLDAAGKWVGVPIKTAAELAAVGYPCMISSMQGFWVKTTGADAKLKLNYNRLVFDKVDYSGICANKPLRSPKRSQDMAQEDMPITGKLKIDLRTEGDADCLFILESERFDSIYEDGYDALKIASESMDIFTIREDEKLSVDATNSILGTRIGLRAGETITYTMSFSHMMSEHELQLFDVETNKLISIYDGLEYTFNVEPNTTITERFIILEREKAPEISTSIESATSNGAKVHKFIKDNQLYILKNGVLYNATGARVH